MRCFPTYFHRIGTTLQAYSRTATLNRQFETKYPQLQSGCPRQAKYIIRPREIMSKTLTYPSVRHTDHAHTGSEPPYNNCGGNDDDVQTLKPKPSRTETSCRSCATKACSSGSSRSRKRASDALGGRGAAQCSSANSFNRAARFSCSAVALCRKCRVLCILWPISDRRWNIIQ